MEIRKNDELKIILIEDNDTKKIRAICDDYGQAFYMLSHTNRKTNIYELDLDTLQKTLIDKNFT